MFALIAISTLATIYTMGVYIPRFFYTQKPSESVQEIVTSKFELVTMNEAIALGIKYALEFESQKKLWDETL